jgi:hypothetical protein
LHHYAWVKIVVRFFWLNSQEILFYFKLLHLEF